LLREVQSDVLVHEDARIEGATDHFFASFPLLSVASGGPVSYST